MAVKRIATPEGVNASDHAGDFFFESDEQPPAYACVWFDGGDESKSVGAEVTVLGYTADSLDMLHEFTGENNANTLFGILNGWDTGENTAASRPYPVLVDTGLDWRITEEQKPAAAQAAAEYLIALNALRRQHYEA